MSFDVDELFRPRSGGPRLLNRWALIAAGVVLIFVAITASAGVYTDSLWFQSLGQSAVFRTRILSPLILFAGIFLVSFFWLVANWWWATRRVTAVPLWPGQTVPGLAGVALPRLAAWAAVGMAFLIGLAAAGNWSTVLLYLHRGSFGVAEPLFGRDAGFYVFSLPFWRMWRDLAGTLVLTSLVGSLAIYAVGGVLDLGNALGARMRGRLATNVTGDGAHGTRGDRDGREGREIREVREARDGGPRQRGGAWAGMSLGRARTHLTLLAVLVALWWAAGQWLGRYELLFSTQPGRSFFGPGVVDTTIRLPAYSILVGLGVVTAATLLASLFARRLWLLAGGLVVLTLAVQVLALDVVPGLVETYRVKPNELERERTYIGHNIQLTRAGFNLDKVTSVAYSPTSTVTAGLLDRQPGTRNNIRLWDWRTLLTTYSQIQEIRTYYGFLDVDVDRYQLAAGSRQVMLAVRELISAEVRNPTWVNLHLEYTHGMGVVVSPVDETDARGLPTLWTRDIPPVTAAPFDRKVTQPRVYFGEAPNDSYVIVNTRTQEFDYPSGEDNTRTTYGGQDGVSLSSLWRRLLFALRFSDVEILLTDAITAQSKLLMRREIATRAAELAPFLTFDQDPYAVLTADGRIVWLYDAYTTSDQFPYAQPLAPRDPELAIFDGVNYLRNSVKVTIDAYDGTVHFYIIDPKDPIVAAWAGVFPTLFSPLDSMPKELAAHWRYPEALFRAQASTYARYHMSDPAVFYNAEDLWAVPTETRTQGESTLPMQPYYATMRLRGKKDPEFVLMLPFTPSGKPNMVAWLAARCDPGHYGELEVYNFTKGELVYGPQQIESTIENEPEISSQLSLWSQRGSTVIRGNLMVIPIEDAILYVEPLFLQAESNALPELKRVIVSDGQRVIMRPTLVEALADLVSVGTVAAARVESGTTIAGANAANAGASESGQSAASGQLPAPDQSPASGQPPAPGQSPASGQPSSSGQPPASASTTAGNPPSSASGAAEPLAGDVPGLVRQARAHQAAAAAALTGRDWTTFGREMDAVQRALDALDALTGGQLPPGIGPTGPAPTGVPAP